MANHVFFFSFPRLKGGREQIKSDHIQFSRLTLRAHTGKTSSSQSKNQARVVILAQSNQHLLSNPESLFPPKGTDLSSQMTLVSQMITRQSLKIGEAEAPSSGFFWLGAHFQETDNHSPTLQTFAPKLLLWCLWTSRFQTAVFDLDSSLLSYSVLAILLSSYISEV